jgi:hypothetical protein
MDYYLAARYQRREELCVYAQVLRSNGHIVRSRWLLGGHQLHAGASQLDSPSGFVNDTDGITMQAQPFAVDDLEDIQNSNVVISFTEKPDSGGRGGRHVEFGIALALGKKLIIIGPRENVFHCLPKVEQYTSWDEFKIRNWMK